MTNISGLEIDAFIFIAKDVNTTEAIYLNSIETKTPINKYNKIMDVNESSELYILNIIIGVTRVTDFNKKLLAIDVSNFPFIFCYVDSRDQSTLPTDDSEFTRDLLNAWNNPKPGHVCCIVVNANIPFTELRYIPITDKE